MAPPSCSERKVRPSEIGQAERVTHVRGIDAHVSVAPLAPERPLAPELPATGQHDVCLPRAQEAVAHGADLRPEVLRLRPLLCRQVQALLPAAAARVIASRAGTPRPAAVVVHADPMQLRHVQRRVAPRPHHRARPVNWHNLQLSPGAAGRIALCWQQRSASDGTL